MPRCRSFEESVEDFLWGYLALVLGIVALYLQNGPELDRGHEEDAELADRLEVAVDLDGPGAVAISEHSPVHLAAEFAPVAAFVVSRELARLYVERFDMFRDLEVLLGKR